MYRLCDAWADLEGAAFKDYYCDKCSVTYNDAKREITGPARDYFVRKYAGVKLACHIDAIRKNGIAWDDNGADSRHI
jgi:hypothetical protein